VTPFRLLRAGVQLDFTRARVTFCSSFGHMNNEAKTINSPNTTIAPFLSVRDGRRALEFYKTAFGAKVVFRIDSESGHVVARLSVDGAEFWVADESPAHHNFSPESLGGGSVRMIMTVKDPDAAFDRAIIAGAKSVCPVPINTAGDWDGWWTRWAITGRSVVL